MGPYRPGKPDPQRCCVLRSESDTVKCCFPCGEKTILDNPVCDRCFDEAAL